MIGFTSSNGWANENKFGRKWSFLNRSKFSSNFNRQKRIFTDEWRSTTRPCWNGQTFDNWSKMNYIFQWNKPFEETTYWKRQCYFGITIIHAKNSQTILFNNNRKFRSAVSTYQNRLGNDREEKQVVFRTNKPSCIDQILSKEAKNEENNDDSGSKQN